MIGKAAFGSITMGATSKTMGTIVNTATKASRIVGIQFSCSATADDQQATFNLKRFTAKGTSGGSGTCYYTNESLGLTPDITCEVSHSVEPTYVSGPGVTITPYQRGMFYWECPTHDMWSPAGTAAGWGLYYPSGPLVPWDITIFFEQ